MESMQEAGVHQRKISLELLARGVLAMLFALGAMATPFMSIRALGALFAIYALADSGLSFFGAAQLRRAHNRKVGWLFAAEGIVSAVLAVVAVIVPSTLILRIVGGLRAVVIGGSDALWAHRTWESVAVEVSGFSSLGLGILLLAWPGSGAVALPWLLALPSLVSGALLVIGAFSELGDEDAARVAT